MKRVRRKRRQIYEVSTWDVLKEVDQLMVHIPSWRPFNWRPIQNLPFTGNWKLEKARRFNRKVKP